MVPLLAVTVITGEQAVTTGVGSLWPLGSPSPSGSGSLPFWEISVAPFVVEVAVTVFK